MMHSVELPSIHLVKTYLIAAAVREARDGEAPELGQDDPLRE